METAIKGKIYVKTDYFEGYATLIDTFPGEIFAVQIELDQPDETGHSVHRVRFSEIVRGEITSTDAEPEQIRYIARVSRPRNGYNVGDEYIVVPSKHEKYFNVHLMNGDMIGSYVNDFFEGIRPYVEQKEIAPVQVESIQEENEPTMSENVIFVKGDKETIIPDQMDIFDFL